jgi:predicted TIM-barrel fold metal-dependent hydrolase
MELADSSNVLFGGDFPFSRHRNPAPDVKSLVAGFERFDGWEHAVRRDIESENARQLFPRLAGAISAAFISCRI